MNTLRTFIAIELPAEVLSAIERVQTQFKAIAPRGVVRWVQPGGIHLTLKFLGEVPATQISAITTGMETAARGIQPFTLTVSGTGCFPNLRRPRVVWVGVQDASGRLARLQRAVEAEISRLGYPPEDRGFTPHLTLGRVERDAAPGDLARLGEAIAAAQVGALGDISVHQIGLIQSILKPSGAEYKPLQHAGLGPLP